MIIKYKREKKEITEYIKNELAVKVKHILLNHTKAILSMTDL